jgi:hypothetical protein
MSEQGNIVNFPSGQPLPPGGMPGSGLGGAAPGGLGGAPPGAAPGSPGRMPGMMPGMGTAGPPMGAAGLPGQMTLNPAFAQWQQMSAGWHAEAQRRRQQFLLACLTIRHDVGQASMSIL